jgi:hypothetical protein
VPEVERVVPTSLSPPLLMMSSDVFLNGPVIASKDKSCLLCCRARGWGSQARKSNAHDDQVLFTKMNGITLR